MYSARRSIPCLLFTFAGMNSSRGANAAYQHHQDVNVKFTPVAPKFNIVLAAVLAGYAFEVYAPPVSAPTYSSYNILAIRES